MDASDNTSFQRMDEGSMRSGMSGATSFRRMEDTDGSSTVMREVSDWDSDGTYLKRGDADDADDN